MKYTFRMIAYFVVVVLPHISSGFHNEFNVTPTTVLFICHVVTNCRKLGFSDLK